MILLYHDPKGETVCAGATTARITAITTQASAQHDSGWENKMIALEKTVTALRNEIEALKVNTLSYT